MKNRSEYPDEFPEVKYSELADATLESSAIWAKRIGNDYIDARHIFVAIYSRQKGLAYRVLVKNGINTEDIRSLVSVLEKEVSKVKHSDFKNEYTVRTLGILENTKKDAEMLGLSEVGTELLLLNIIKDRNLDIWQIFKNKNIQPNALCQNLLIASGVKFDLVKKYMESLVIDERKKATANKKSSSSTLDQFARDLSMEAELGSLDPVVGRYNETVRVMQILGRRAKNNACLVGEPGVGKTAIVEGLAQLIHENNVPENLKGKRILSLDLSGMLAGTRFRGDFEERLKNTIDELKNDPDIILFIDELHTLIGAGGSEGTHDAANIFKPALSRGELHVIGATTLEEYRKYIEKDAALERRFQPVTVEEPSKAETLEILKGLKKRYETFHDVTITDEALEAAVDYSERYINDRFLPDKAIDLVDEACSRVKLGKVPEDFGYTHISEDIKFLNEELDEALKSGEMIRAGRIRNNLEILREGENISSRSGEIVTEDDIAEVVAVWTKIPVARLTETEQTKIINLDRTLSNRVIGQSEAVKAVASAIKRNRAGLRSPDRPIGAFLFMGPTGVGKTELSKALAEALFGNEKSLIRVDMSEYMEKHNVSKLIGSPPGYVGYDEGGQLSEMVRRNPYSVVLFDEVEKAHPDVFNVLLQVLDDGVITDSQGRHVNFKNTIIIMTSNLGAEKIIDPKSMGFVTNNSEDASHEEMKSRVMDSVKELFKPEFLNRLDDIIVFRALGEEQVLEIADLMLRELKNRIFENSSIKLSYGVKLKRFISEKGFDKKFGARPLRRAIQQYIEDPLSEMLLSGEIKKGDTVSVSVPGEEIKFSVKQKYNTLDNKL